MFKLKLKQKPIKIAKLFIILALLTGISGCRALSDFFDPAKNAPKKQLKAVKRDKPNLADDTEKREVDPDSDTLVEATDEEVANEKVASEIPTNTNVATNTDTSITKTNEVNSNVSQTNANKEKAVAVETFTKSLIGTWTNEREKVVVDQNRMIFYLEGKLVTDTSYRIVDEKTVEFTDSSGKKNSAVMSIEDNNTTLVWQRPDLKEVFKYKRAEPNADNSQQQPKEEPKPRKIIPVDPQ